MARAKPRTTSTMSVELRLVRWLLAVLLWRLPRALLRLLAWLVGTAIRAWPSRQAEAEPGDGFYRSYKWRRLRVDALEANRLRYGMLACECCGMVDVASWHVDHIYPRSAHPELALDPDNLQVLCDACNVGKGIHYTTNWRGGREPVPVKRGGWRRFRVG